MTLRAKFSCTHVDDYGTYKQVHLSTVYSNTKEDNQFSIHTPSGEMKMVVSSDSGKTFFEPGKQYYLDFSEASN